MTRARDVANAGHSTTATTADTISQKTSIDLSGTYSTHQLLVADAYNFAGDTTVNDNLILGKLSDDGNDFVLEGSHTLQGTGQLEAGYVTSSGIGSVDGMTGELGSAITGSPNLNLTTGTLGSGVTFPTGHMIFLGEKRVTSTAATISNATSWTKTGNGTAARDLDLTIPAATVAKFSKIVVTASHMMIIGPGSAFTLAETKFRRENSNGDSDLGFRHIIGFGGNQHNFEASCQRSEIDTSLPSSGDVTYSLQVRKHHGNAAYADYIGPLGAETDTTAVIFAYGVV